MLCTTMRPSLRFTSSIASGTISDALAELVSTTASTPRPAVIFLTSSSTSCWSATSVWSAPSSRPTCKRRSSRASPTRITRSAPADFDAMTQPSPCWPGPSTTMLRPGPTWPSTTAHCTPLPKRQRHRRLLGRDVVGHAVEHRRRRHVQVVAVAAPQAGRGRTPACCRSAARSGSSARRSRRSVGTHLAGTGRNARTAGTPRWPRGRLPSPPSAAQRRRRP